MSSTILYKTPTVAPPKPSSSSDTLITLTILQSLHTKDQHPHHIILNSSRSHITTLTAPHIILPPSKNITTTTTTNTMYSKSSKPSYGRQAISTNYSGSTTATASSGMRPARGYGSKPVTVHNGGGSTRDPQTSSNATNNGYWK